LKRLKPFLRWIILGAVFFFLAKALKDNWQAVASTRLERHAWAWLAIALVITTLAHIWSGLVWSWILRSLNHPVPGRWAIKVYLLTNIGKYLPGNVWHFYGRVQASTKIGIPTTIAALSVLLEPLLMAAAALLVALMGSQQQHWEFQALTLGIVLVGVHPWVLNPVLMVVGRLKAKATKTPNTAAPAYRIEQYPLVPLLGELGFLGLRALGFLAAMQALLPVPPEKIPLFVSAFSAAWLLGLVVPGAPGGIGVFEATAITLLGQQVSPGLLLSTVAIYRLVSVSAEALGAGGAWISDRRSA
jgi:glycosyltransferase 2 family protein